MGILLGKAFGAGLQQTVEDAYRYLMDRYEAGDRVFLFGFSRGAFTVRALAGMLHKCGLLQTGSNNLIPYASKIYNRRDNQDIAAGSRKHIPTNANLTSSGCGIRWGPWAGSGGGSSSIPI